MLTIVGRQIRSRLSSLGGESGQALLFVLIAVTLLASIPIAIATTTVDQLPQTTRNLNYEAAYQAAQAGLNDYLQKLDGNGAYGIYTATNKDPSNPAMSGWVQASTSPPEYYSYLPYNNSGLISLQVTGKAGVGSGTVVRTFQYAVAPASTLDDVYWSNYETLDPTIAAQMPNPPSGYADCGVHYGQLDPDYANGNHSVPQYGPPPGCIVVFVSGDELNGPVFSDDTFRLCGSPTFDAGLQSGNIYNTNTGPTSVYVDGNGGGCSGSVPNFANGSGYQKVGNQIPQNSEADLSPARSYGCFITGGSGNSVSPVNVTLGLSIAGGTTKVTWSGSGASVDNVASNTNNCSSPISVDQLTSGLIFVNGNVSISGQMTGGLDIVTCSTTTVTATNARCTGSAAPSNITITGSLTYPSANIVKVNGQPTSDSSDTLGLIAQNSVIVADVPHVEIDAAILALQDSFYVTNWWSASGLGALNVFGSIAQNFRGAVGTTGHTGYLKNYNYDTSLQTLFPPFFIPPNGAVWSPTSYEECATGDSQSVLNTPHC
ncbi:MAG TPA: hypothetical protein VNC61_10370 [Acidimicrobiales bacterium]|nr:hypothetical protein [Acidimicrobiales bacterium]